MVAPLRSISGHMSDILCVAKMPGSSLIASSDYGGHIMTWNVASGALRRTFISPTHQNTPAIDLAVEKVLFLPGK